MAYTYEYPRPSVTADCVVFNFIGGNLKVLLIKRGNNPYKGLWAFPGGFLDMDEPPLRTAMRELNEETGLEVEALEQIGVFGEVNRDPRGRVISIAFVSLLKDNKEDLQHGSDAAELRWWDLEKAPSLAFDHDLILTKAVQKIKDMFALALLQSRSLFRFSKEEMENVLRLLER
jgi:8-oxo-dGTP diphosphatase